MTIGRYHYLIILNTVNLFVRNECKLERERGRESRKGGAVFFEPNQKIWFNCQPLYYKSRPRESRQRYFLNQLLWIESKLLWIESRSGWLLWIESRSGNCRLWLRRGVLSIKFHNFDQLSQFQPTFTTSFEFHNIFQQSLSFNKAFLFP